MIVAATGHRPKYLSADPYNPNLNRQLHAFALIHLEMLMPEKIYVGMALGWDQAVAAAASDLSIPFIAAVPFKGQDRLWPTTAQQRYHELLAKAADVVIVSEGSYAGWQMIARDRYMVDQAQAVFALWNGSKDSGTGKTVLYAKEEGRRIINVWDDWKGLTG